MSETLKFLLFAYWFDFDSVASGYRFVILLVWAVLIVGVIVPAFLIADEIGVFQ